MKIITGYKGEAHITSSEIQGENQGIFGTGSYVLNVGNKFSPTLISANELQIADGEGVIQGVHFRVDPGTYDSVTIENGAQGMNRKDLVVCRYTKDSETGVEETEWVVIKGTATSGTATRPSATTGDILGGSTLAEMAMFEVVLSGINVTAVNPLFSVLKSMKELLDLENELNSKAISYVDVSDTTGTTLYGAYYYANIAIPQAARTGFISATILTAENLRYATVQRISDTQVRVYCDQSEKAVSVRIAYQ